MNHFNKIASVLYLKAIIIGFVCCLLTACSDEQLFVEELKTIAVNVNKKCPQMIDSETRLDGISVKKPDTLVYQYTLVNLNKFNADTHLFYKAMWPGILSFIKISNDMKKLRDNNTIIHYRYNDKNNKFFYLFKITPTDYKQKNSI